jgi:hypothetical protein
LASSAPRRLIDITEHELQEIIFAAMAQHTPAALSPPPELLDRQGAAQLLKISLSKLDQLSRREQDPLVYRVVGSVRRYLRADLLAWFNRQPANA